MVVFRWFNRLLGIISISITARLLSPEDFGVMGSATLVLGFFLTLNGLGLGEVLVHLKTVTDRHLNTVWTIKILVTMVLLGLVIVSAPYLASIMGEPKLSDVIVVLMVGVLLSQLQSPGTFVLLREFSYRKILLFRSVEKILKVLSVVGLAIYLRNYWALAFGQMLGAVLGVLLSYLICPFKPSFTLSRLGSVQTFLFWTLWRDIAQYLAQVADELTARLTNPTEIFAYYRTARDVSRMTVTELVAPAASPVFAALSRIQDDTERMSRAITAAVGSGTLIAFPAAVGVHYTAPEIVHLILGSQWTSMIPVLEAVAFGVAANTLAGLARSVYAALGNQRAAATAWLLRAMVIFVSCYSASTNGSIQDIAVAFSIATGTFTFLEYAYVFRLIGHKYPLYQLYFLPLVATGVMAVFLHFVTTALADFFLLKLVATVFTGATVYGGMVLAITKMSPKPSIAVHALASGLPSRYRALIL